MISFLSKKNTCDKNLSLRSIGRRPIRTGAVVRKEVTGCYKMNSRLQLEEIETRSGDKKEAMTMM